MTFPVHLNFFGHAIAAHQVLQFAAYAAGYQLYRYLRARFPRGPKLTTVQSTTIVIGAILGALIGSKFLGLLESFPLYWSHRDDWRFLLSGKTIVGALFGGWVGVELAKGRLRITHPSGDVYVFPVILGMCIGRVGGFLAGLPDGSHGIESTLPWAVDFGDGLLRHPTQFYEIAFLLLAGGFFWWRLGTLQQRGCMFSQFMLSYLAFRFLCEFLKPRWTPPYLPLSPIQFACLAGIIYAIVHWNDTCCPSIPVEQGTGAASRPDLTPRFFELTTSLCAICLQKVDAKVLIETDGIYLQKFCPDHGMQRVLIATDVEYWLRSRAIHKPPTAPLRRNTDMHRGCPYDCGLCPDHEQHSCLAIVEITDACNLACPICYASSAHSGHHRSLAEIEGMLDAIVANEGHVNVVQISGGEPTLHPDLFAILDAVRKRPIRHLMLNTNGKRIAEDPAFAARLKAYLPGFEVYLQFDSLNPTSLRELRGVDLTDIRRRALAALNEQGISTTLVVTLKKGVNDQEIGQILDFAIAQPCVRGVTFQPIQAAGRLGDFNPATHRLTLTEVRSQILRQHTLFTAADLVPVPCHTDSLAMAYAVRRGKSILPLSRVVSPQALLNIGGNTICYEQDPRLRQQVVDLFSASHSPASAAAQINDLCCTPGLPPGSALKYDSVFRVIIMQFMDAHSMDLRSVKRSCVHIAHSDGRLIPFDTYNLLYRNARSAHCGIQGPSAATTAAVTSE